MNSIFVFVDKDSLQESKFLSTQASWMSYISGSLSGVQQHQHQLELFFEMYILRPPSETLGLGPTTRVLSSLQVSLMQVKV